MNRLHVYSYKITFISVFFVFLGLFVTNSVLAANLSASSNWSHARSDLPADVNTIFGELSNGFRYVILPNQEPRDRVSMHLNVQAGSMHETESQRGLAHFLEHMLFNGSTHFPPNTLVNYFQSIGMRFGPDANAHTGFYETVYDILLPDGSKDQLQKALVVMSDFAQGALLLEDEINRERGIVLAEKQDRDSAAYRIFEKALVFETSNTRLSQRLPIGTENVLKNATRTDLKAYYDTWYRPEKQILVVVGDVVPQTLIPLIEKQFSPMPARALAQPEPSVGAIHHNGTNVFYAYEEEMGSTSVTIEVFRSVSPESDTLQNRQIELQRDMAMQCLENRLTELLNDPKAPFTSVSVGYSRFFQTIESASITAQCTPENWQATLQILTEKFHQAMMYGFLPQEVERVRADKTVALETAVKMADTRQSQRLASGIISAVNANKVWMSPADQARLFAPVLQTTTSEEVHQAFLSAWEEDHRLLLVTGNASIRSPKPKEEIRRVFTAAWQKTPPKPTPPKKVVFPYFTAPEKGEIRSKTEIQELGITQVQFANGLTLHLKPTSFKRDEVTALLRFGSGRKGEPIEKPALAVLTERVVNESGVGPLTSDMLQKALAGRMAEVALNVDAESITWVGQSTREEVPLLIQLLYAHIIDLAIRNTAYTLVQNRYKQDYADLSQSPDGMFAIEGQRFLANGDTRFGLVEPALFQQLTVADIQNWYLPQLNVSDMELSIVGDFDVSRVIAEVQQYLGGILKNEKTITPAPRPEPTFATGKETNLLVSSQIPKALVVVAYPTIDYWDISQTRRFSVLTEIITDQLRKEVREKLGITYSPYAVHRPSRAYADFGYLMMVVSVDPAQADTAVLAVTEVVRELVSQGITEDQFHRAITPMLASIKDSQRTNSYWMNVLRGATQHPEQFRWAQTIWAEYTAITIAELNELARQYLGATSPAVLHITTPPSTP